MYTQTGYDASAHISEETHGAAIGAAKGVWRSVFWAGVVGWLVLLAITFAATDVGAVNDGGGSSLAIFDSVLTSSANKAVVLIATIGQLFCGMACLTSASRMCYAFSRDRAVPGHQLWTRLNHHRVPAYSVLAMAAAALIVTIPALWGDGAFPWPFFAVVSITVIGLYVAYAIPIFLRWRQGDSWQPGPWTLGRHYRWVNPAACIWVVICVIVFVLPFTPAGVPWNDEFEWSAVNYAPITFLLAAGLIMLWWVVSARNHFTGPIREIDIDELGRVQEGPADPTAKPPPSEGA
jgi:amino acid transporter